MILRFRIDALFVFLFTVYFQIVLDYYNKSFQLAKVEVMEYITILERGSYAGQQADLANQLTVLATSLSETSGYLFGVIIVSSIQLLLPLTSFWEWYFTMRTNRKTQGISVTFVNELCLFVVVIWILNDWFRFKKYDDAIPFVSETMTSEELVVANIMWR